MAGVYWTGTDGNVWVKGDQGTNSAGAYDLNSDEYWGSRGYSKIGDPSVSLGDGGHDYGAFDPVSQTWQDNGVSARVSPEQQAQSAARNQFNTGRDSINSGVTSKVNDYVANQRFDIEALLNQYQSQQGGIDDSRINSTINRQRGTQDILGMMGRGIQSGGTMLANRNASDSSAAGAIARAYGQLGQRQQSGINNQFEQQNNSLNKAQTDLDKSKSLAYRQKNDEFTRGQPEAIAEEARKQFQALNDMALGAGITERIQIEQEKERIRGETLSRLAELDSMVGGLNNIQGMGQDQIGQQAQQRMAAGQATPDQFSYSTDAPATMQGGAQMGQLPIYSNRKRY